MVTTSLLIGDVLTGRIRVTLDGPELPNSLRWTDELNKAGSIDGVTIPEALVRKYELRQMTDGIRCFLAVEVNGRIKQAGPIWSRTWNDDSAELTLGAKGLWSYLDKRLIYPLPSTEPYAANVFTVTGKSLGGIARALVANMLATPFSGVPIVLPADEAGTNTESFPLYSLLDYGEQLRQITQRATDAPDIRFTPRRTAADPRFIEWVMQVGTVDAPALRQGGPDWVFDRSAPRSQVLGISTDEDASEMAETMFVSGEGQEESTPMAYAQDLTLLQLSSPWPLTQGKNLHSTVSDADILQGHADSDLMQVARPIEVFKVRVRADVANEVAAGDYARTITRGDTWLGDLDISTRVRQVSGGLDDEITLDMFAIQALT